MLVNANLSVPLHSFRSGGPLLNPPLLQISFFFFLIVANKPLPHHMSTFTAESCTGFGVASAEVN